MLVTSFGEEGFVRYGKRFLLSYIQHCDTPLIVYHEGMPEDAPQHELIQYRSLFTVPGVLPFIHDLQQSPQAPAFRGETKDGGYDFRFDAFKFFRKPLALYDAWRKELRAGSRGRLIWLDADTRFLRKTPFDWSQILVPDDIPITYLGRLHMHSECGFIGFNLRYVDTLARFFRAYRDVYLTGSFQYFKEWHDSYLFDAVCTMLRVPRASLSGQQGEKDLYPWDHSILSAWLAHDKGPERKMLAEAEEAA